MRDELVDRIYEAAVVPQLWPDVLRRIGHRFDTKGGLLFANSPEGTRWVGGGPVTDVMNEFLRQGWMEQNTRPALLLERSHPGFLTETHILSEDEIAAIPMFRDFLIPKGCFATAGTVVPGLEGDTLILSVEGFRTHRAARDAIPMLDELRPHLARAAQLAGQFRLERLKGHVDALEAIGAPAGVVRADGTLQLANARLTAELGRAVLDGKTRLRMADRRADALLSLTLVQLRNGEGEGRSIAARDTKYGPRVLHVVPIRREAQDLFIRSLALVVLTNPRRPLELRADTLQHLFDLTPAEAKLAARIGAENTPISRLAAEFGVSVNTLRAQLQAIFMKTGVRRQTDLARLLLVASTVGVAPEDAEALALTQVARS